MMTPPLTQKIAQIKREKNALIIAHYYQEPEIQDIADYVGDSYGMALFAKDAQYELACVCGVKFMAETFQIMNPDKKIVLPDLNAGCSLADSCTPEVFDYFKAKHAGAFVMTYINSSVDIKAKSDVICTSSNAVKIAGKIPAEKKIIFAPDRHLGKYLAKKTGREFILFPGNCFVHTSFSAQAMFKLKKDHPRAKIIAHPECEEVVLREAHFIGSTSQLLKFTKEDAGTEFIVMTESGIIYQMQKLSPEKSFISGPDLSGCACNVCPHMKLNTLEKIYACLVNERPSLSIPPELARKALIPLQRMVEMSGS